ncbi:MAG: NAD(P)-dependent oxidoreductase [Nitrospiraceae bacterium]
MTDPDGNRQTRRYRILNLEPDGYSEQARQMLQSVGEINEGPLRRAELLARLSEYEVLIVRLGHQIDREMLDAGARLKVVVSATTGLDHIDLDATQARDIAVLSLRGEQAFLRGITATAEHTWGLLLSLMRRIPEAVQSVLAGRWDRDAYKGCDLAGKRMGIVGLGRLGRQVAEYGAAFRMNVAAYDPNITDWPVSVERRQSLSDLLADTDVLSIHVNLHRGTVKLIGKSELARLPNGAVLLNTSRGQVVDEEALHDALVSGHLRGAAIDVLADERCEEKRQRSNLIVYAKGHHNLLITPHLGGATSEAMRKTELFMANKLVQFLHSSQVSVSSHTQKRTA